MFLINFTCFLYWGVTIKQKNALHTLTTSIPAQSVRVVLSRVASSRTLPLTVCRNALDRRFPRIYKEKHRKRRMMWDQQWRYIITHKGRHQIYASHWISKKKIPTKKNSYNGTHLGKSPFINGDPLRNITGHNRWGRCCTHILMGTKPIKRKQNKKPIEFIYAICPCFLVI